MSRRAPGVCRYGIAPDMLNERINALGQGPFQRLTALLRDVTPAVNRASFNLSVGEPRHPYPDFVGTIVDDNRSLYGGYPPAAGTPAYRAAAAGWLTRRYGLSTGSVDPEQHVLPLNGTREGLFLVTLLVVPERKAGAQPLVLLPNPFYHPYAAATLAGAELRYLPATKESGFLPDFDSVSDADFARTALIYLCTPANPQGAVAPLGYLERLIARARAHDVVLAIDECYAEIYTGEKPPGALEACARLGRGFANVLVFHSLSKRSSVPGLRCGFVAGDAALLKAFLAFRNYSCAQIPYPMLAAGAALWNDEDHVEANRALYRAKFDCADAALGGHADYRRPAGSFFLWLKVEDSERACVRLWREAGVRVLPGNYLGRAVDGRNPGEGYVRVALVDSIEETEAALAALRRAL